LIVRLRWTPVVVRIRWTPVFPLPKIDFVRPLREAHRPALAALVLAVGIPLGTEANLPKAPLKTRSKEDAVAERLAAFMRKRGFAEPFYVKEIVHEAMQAAIPPSLLVCIEFLESSGGKYYARETNNPFGWKSGEASFASVREAIRHISSQLGSGRYYGGKTLEEKVRMYNPRPVYAEKLFGCMKQAAHMPAEVSTSGN
jgi:hypothetical protein